MEISKITILKDNFKSALDKNYVFDSKFLEDTIPNFQEHWTLAADDLPTMWGNSLHSNISRHFWQHQNHEPKRWISTFFKQDADFTKSMFYELFNEEVPALSNKLERFQYYSEEMLKLYRSKDKMSIETNHHQDYPTMMLYLTLMFPQSYALYNREDVVSFVRFVKAKTPYEFHDMDRYKKLIKLIYTIVSKDDDLITKFNKLYAIQDMPQNKFAIVYELLKHANR